MNTRDVANMFDTVQRLESRVTQLEVKVKKFEEASGEEVKEITLEEFIEASPPKPTPPPMPKSSTKK